MVEIDLNKLTKEQLKQYVAMISSQEDEKKVTFVSVDKKRKNYKGRKLKYDDEWYLNAVKSYDGSLTPHAHLFKLFGRNTCVGEVDKFRKLLKKYGKEEKKGRGYYKKTEHHKEMIIHKAPFFKFKSDKIKKYCAEGIDYMIACKMANNDWNKYKHAKDGNTESKHKVEDSNTFTPQEISFITIKDENTKKILFGMIRHIVNYDGKMTYETDAYAIGIDDITTWNTFCHEFMAKTEEICRFLGGIDNNFRLWDKTDGSTHLGIKYGY